MKNITNNKTEFFIFFREYIISMLAFIKLKAKVSNIVIDWH